MEFEEIYFSKNSISHKLNLGFYDYTNFNIFYTDDDIIVFYNVDLYITLYVYTINYEYLYTETINTKNGIYAHDDIKINDKLFYYFNNNFLYVYNIKTRENILVFNKKINKFDENWIEYENEINIIATRNYLYLIYENIYLYHIKGSFHNTEIFPLDNYNIINDSILGVNYFVYNLTNSDILLIDDYLNKRHYIYHPEHGYEKIDLDILHKLDIYMIKFDNYNNIIVLEDTQLTEYSNKIYKTDYFNIIVINNSREFVTYANTFPTKNGFIFSNYGERKSIFYNTNEIMEIKIEYYNKYNK